MLIVKLNSGNCNRLALFLSMSRNFLHVAAPELERAVGAATRPILGDRAAIAGAIEEFNIDASRLPSIFSVAEARIKSLQSQAEAASVLSRLIERVGLKQDGIHVSIKLPIASDEGRDATPNELALARFRLDADEAARR